MTGTLNGTCIAEVTGMLWLRQKGYFSVGLAVVTKLGPQAKKGCVHAHALQLS
jgi:hypothetical protein